MNEVSRVLSATPFRDWSYARAWLAAALSGEKQTRNS
jgi:hypothetical protein